MEKKITKKYTNGDVTVVWQPHLCIHSAICFNGLPHAFDPRKRPWITLDITSTEEVIAQVKKCPSAALSFYMNNDVQGKVELSSETITEVIPNGPLMVYGNISVKDSKGIEKKNNKVTAFCRCGASKNKPYCDGSHKTIGFVG